MSFEAKLILSVCVLAVVLPIGLVTLRRMLRGEHPDKTSTGTIMPPSGPPLDGGGT